MNITNRLVIDSVSAYGHIFISNSSNVDIQGLI